MEATHHAWLYQAADIPDTLLAALRAVDTEIVVIEEPTLGIDTVRQLTAAAHTTSLTHATRTCVLVTTNITLESQNALLKLLEEPPAHTSFYIVIPQTGGLIPTLRSRLQVHAVTDTQSIPADWKQFKAMSLADQLHTVAERVKTKDTAWQQAILAGAAADLTIDRQTVLLLDTYLGTRGAANKMLLEALVLSLHD